MMNIEQILYTISNREYVTINKCNSDFDLKLKEGGIIRIEKDKIKKYPSFIHKMFNIHGYYEYVYYIRLFVPTENKAIKSWSFHPEDPMRAKVALIFRQLHHDEMKFRYELYRTYFPNAFYDINKED